MLKQIIKYEWEMFCERVFMNLEHWVDMILTFIEFHIDLFIEYCEDIYGFGITVKQFMVRYWPATIYFLYKINRAAASAEYITSRILLVLWSYPISLALYHTHWVLNVGTLVFTTVVCTNILYASLTPNTFTKFNHLVVHLLLGACLLGFYKNEQFVPLYLLTEFGTLFVLFNIIKGTHRSYAVQHAGLPIAAYILLVVTPLLWAGGNVYWIDIQTLWLQSVQISHDFTALMVTTLDLAHPTVVYLFVYLLALTLIFIVICTTPRANASISILTKHQVTKTSWAGFNSISDFKAKTQDSAVQKFTK